MDYTQCDVETPAFPPPGQGHLPTPLPTCSACFPPPTFSDPLATYRRQLPPSLYLPFFQCATIHHTMENCFHSLSLYCGVLHAGGRCSPNVVNTGRFGLWTTNKTLPQDCHFYPPPFCVGDLWFVDSHSVFSDVSFLRSFVGCGCFRKFNDI